MPLPPIAPAIRSQPGRDHASRGLVGGCDPVDTTALNQDCTNRRQRCLEHFQSICLAYGLRCLNGHHAVDPGIDDIVDADHVTENGLCGLLQRHA